MAIQRGGDQLKKPMLVNETIPGALDDAVRAGVARFYTEQLSAAGLGWMGWALREGKAISPRGAIASAATGSTARVFTRGSRPTASREAGSSS